MPPLVPKPPHPQPRPRTRTRTLLITLDAFQTLYRPRRAIATQYLSVAASHHGLHIADPSSATTIDAFTASFRKAFQANYARAPNYGYGSGSGSGGGRVAPPRSSPSPSGRRLPLTPALTPERWWRCVVHDTFAPLLEGSGERVPEGLADSLFRWFGGREAYEPVFGCGAVFEAGGAVEGRGRGRGRGVGERVPVRARAPKVVVGVLTNSDPRVSSVLGSLGVAVGVPAQRRDEVAPGGEGVGHVDFVLTSYEIGVEKPHPRAFLAAERMARWVSRRSATRPTLSGLSSSSVAPPHPEDVLVPPEEETKEEEEDDMLKVHIGDDLHKDYLGAIGAGRGWHAILLDRTTRHSNSTENRHAETTGQQPGRKVEGADNASVVDDGARRISSLTDAMEVILQLSRQQSRRGGCIT
ncbi:hypothetical protein GJ744_005901 [Endocarpon pusillum]|uniref:Uncharacterized protein n=1 Tax=Endocarpon pusillum TaxID=364733 RepID=A0A8H7APP9_9EURO|nr:hypothetical protein GJ744_005901 [Endocarpon pusillum]